MKIIGLYFARALEDKLRLTLAWLRVSRTYQKEEGQNEKDQGKSPARLSQFFTLGSVDHPSYVLFLSYHLLISA